MRHGETAGGNRYCGQTDVPLSPAGWAQMQSAVGERCEWDVVISSPLIRCRAFAEQLAARHGLPLELDARLREIGFGAWEGHTADEIDAEQPGALMAYYADPELRTPPGGEALTAFRQRVATAWQELLHHQSGRRTLVVAHAGVIRAILALVLDLPSASLLRIHVSHAGVTRIRCDGTEGNTPFCQLLFHTDTR